MALEVKYLKGSSDKYEALLEQNLVVSTNFYFIDGKDLYLGKIKLSNQEDIKLAITSIQGDYSGELAPTLKDLDDRIKELDKKIEELNITPDERYVTKVELDAAIAEVKADTEIVVEDVSELKIKADAAAADLVIVKESVEKLNNISLGIGGEGEPATILFAIAENNAKIELAIKTSTEEVKEEIMNYVNESLTWAEITL